MRSPNHSYYIMGVLFAKAFLFTPGSTRGLFKLKAPTKLLHEIVEELHGIIQAAMQVEYAEKEASDR